MSEISCLVIGIDNHVGAYLTRLLNARGVGAGGGLGGVGAADLVARLGVADAVVATTAADTARVAAHAQLVFAISDGSAERADLVAETVDAVAAATRPARLIHVADIADLALPQVHDTIQRITAASRAETATIRLAAHDSRLGSRDTVMGQIIGAAAAASAQAAPQNLVIAEIGPRDWGWTPEYVDAVQRMASRDRMIDIVVASGHRLTVAEITQHAFGYFRQTDNGVTITGAGSAVPAIDPAPVFAATGWRATTFGRDLVRTSCEGTGERR